MNRFILGISLFIIASVTLSVIAQAVGGISLRSAGERIGPIQLDISEPVIPGVPTVLHIQSENDVAREAMKIEWRTAQKTINVGVGLNGINQIPITIPCDTAPIGSLIMRSQANDKVLVQRPLNVFPPGADCL